MAASIDVLDISHGKPFIISAHTRTNASVYLTTDNVSNDLGDQRAQTWNHDPVQDAGHNKDYAATMQWHINSNDDGTYTIRTNPNWRALTFKRDTLTAWTTDHTGADNQRWFFTPWPAPWATPIASAPLKTPTTTCLKRQKTL